MSIVVGSGVMETLLGFNDHRNIHSSEFLGLFVLLLVQLLRAVVFFPTTVFDIDSLGFGLPP